VGDVDFGATAAEVAVEGQFDLSANQDLNNEVR